MSYLTVVNPESKVLQTQSMPESCFHDGDDFEDDEDEYEDEHDDYDDASGDDDYWWCVRMIDE